jgi:hypothetical protein
VAGVNRIMSVHVDRANFRLWPNYVVG